MMQPQPDWAEHSITLVSVAIIIMGGLLSIIGVFLTRAMNATSAVLENFRDDIKALFGRMEKTEQRVARLEGSCEARTGMKLKY